MPPNPCLAQAHLYPPPYLPKMSHIETSTLKNGIKLVTEEMPDIGSVTIGVWVQVGSRNESMYENGISHFIEHLLFKGTERRTALDIAREIESVGGVLNAFTGKEYTCYYARVLAKDTPLSVDLLSDIFINSTFDKNEMEKEREVILQEIKMVEDTPDDIIHDIFSKTIWKDHPLGRPVLGDYATVSSIKREDILSYFGRYYSPQTILITAAGKLRHGELLRLLDRSFGTIKSRFGSYNLDPPNPFPRICLEKRNLEQVHLCIGVPALPQVHHDRYRLYLLNSMLGGGMSSRLFQEIREKRGLAYSIYSYLNLRRDVGTLVVYAGTSEGSFSTVVSLILKEFNKIADGIDKSELSMAKEQLMGNIILNMESSENRMTKLARDMIYYGRVIPLDETVSHIKAVKTKEIKRLAETTLDTSATSLAAVGRVKKKGLPDLGKRR